MDGFGDVFLFASQVLELLFICFVVISCSMDGARYVFTEVVWNVFPGVPEGLMLGINGLAGESEPPDL